MRFLSYVDYLWLNLNIIIYQMKAEYLSYVAVSIILLFINNIKIYNKKSTEVLIFHLHFFKCIHRLLTLSEAILDMIMERKVVSILFIKVLVIFSCNLENDFSKLYKIFPEFLHKIKIMA